MSTLTPPRLRPSLLAAIVLVSAAGLAPVPPVTAVTPTTDYVARCTLDLESSPVAVATSVYPAAITVASIRAGAGISAQAAVAGDAWSLTCNSSTVSGTSWFPITAISGTPAGNLYSGYSLVYAPTGLFRSSPGYVEGIDVSHWQGTIDWPTVAGKGGKKFAFMKATEDTNFVDSQYRTNHAAARAVGIRTGAYHFAQPSTSTADAVAQADWFVAHIGLTAGDLFPVLDLETRNGLTDAQLITWVQAFMNEVYVKTGIKGIIYVSPSFWSSYMNDTTWFAANGYTVLWVAHWFVTSPRTPGSNWGGKGWTFWQYSDCGKVPGIGGGSCVDLDRYNGTDMTRVTYAPDFGLGITSATSQLPASNGGSTASTTSGSTASTPPGGTAAYNLAISRQYFTLPVDVDVTGLPEGARASWSVDPATGAATVLSVETSVDGVVTPPGSYPLTITGSATLQNVITGEGDLISRTASATLQVVDPDFSVTAPAVAGLSGPTKQGASASWKVSIGRRFVDSPISLSIAGLPAGTAATFTPDSIAAGGTSGTLTVATNGTTPTPLGSYALTLSAVGSAPATAGGGEISHASTVTLVVSDGIAPTTSTPASRLYAVSTPSSSTTPVRTSWSGADASGIKSYTLQRQVDGGAWATVSLASATSTSIVQSLRYGHTYRYRVRATDRNGNVGAWSYGLPQRPILSQQTSPTITWSSGYWSTAYSSSYLGGSTRYTYHRGSWASCRATGSSFAWVAYRAPTRGKAAVYVDGLLAATVNLYASSYQARRTVWAIAFPTAGTHTIRIVDLGTSGHPRIDVDGFIRLANN